MRGEDALVADSRRGYASIQVHTCLYGEGWVSASCVSPYGLRSERRFPTSSARAGVPAREAGHVWELVSSLQPPTTDGELPNVTAVSGSRYPGRAPSCPGPASVSACCTCIGQSSPPCFAAASATCSPDLPPRAWGQMMWYCLSRLRRLGISRTTRTCALTNALRLHRPLTDFYVNVSCSGSTSAHRRYIPQCIQE